MRIGVLAYDFPHRRSFDFTLRLAMAGLGPTVVIGAPWKALNHRRSRIEVTRDRSDLQHVKDLCAFLHVPYFVADHGSSECQSLLRKCDLAVIAGARILPRVVTEMTPILNLHPGLIPENRGLDNVVNAVARDIPQAITAHLVDGRVDAGTIISITLVPVLPNDGFVEMGERVFDMLSTLVVPTVRGLMTRSHVYTGMPKDIPPANIPGDPDTDTIAEQRLAEYVKKWGNVWAKKEPSAS